MKTLRVGAIMVYISPMKLMTSTSEDINENMRGKQDACKKGKQQKNEKIQELWEHKDGKSNENFINTIMAPYI